VFDYDDILKRISKRVLDNSNNWKYTTFYVRDAQGNVMSTYDQKVVSMAMTFKLKEQDIFGSSRIGLNLPEKEIIGASVSSTTLFHTLGKKQYELSNHLGNVLSIITDRKIPVEDSGSPGTIEYSIADVASAQDYSAFGVKLYGRGFEFSGYRYGFNGKESDPETVGTAGGTQDYGMRIYYPALGRFLSVDPLTKSYPELTPYQFASNKPVKCKDLDGGEAEEEGEEVIRGYRTDPSSNSGLEPAEEVEFDEEISPEENLRRIEEYKNQYENNPNPTTEHLETLPSGQTITAPNVNLLRPTTSEEIEDKTPESENTVNPASNSARPVPRSARNVLNYANNKNGAAQPGYKGGRVFENKEGILPKTNQVGQPITYREYDVNPKPTQEEKDNGQDRGTERVVIDNYGNGYYTNDHYETFTPITPEENK
jgi:RHS repeat-associated protein